MIYLVTSLLFSLLVAAFAVQNAHPVVVRFVGWQLETSLALLLIGSSLAGACIAALLALFRQVGVGLKLMDERSRSARTSNELEQARLAASEMRRELERAHEHNRRLTAQIAASDRSGDAPAPAAGAPDDVQDGSREQPKPRGDTGD